MKPLTPRIQNYYTQSGVGSDIVLMQTAYQIDFYQGSVPVFSTGKRASGRQNNICLNLPLQEQSEYSFTVSAWDENDTAETSDPAYFSTGVRHWRGEWIGNGTKKPFLARKRFLAGKNEKGILSVCVPGQFEVRINGRPISEYAYEGSQTDFHKRVHYWTYDVTKFLADGENEITVEAANGWYLGDDGGGTRHFYTIDKGYEPYGKELALLLQLKLGDKYLFTDSSWEVSPSRTVLADIYGSEDMDYTAPYSWTNALIVQPPRGEIQPAQYPPAIRKYCFEPVSVDKERMIFDFGQNMSSQFSLKIKGNRGQKVKLIPAEKLAADGNIEQTTNTYSVLTLSGGEDLFEQRFSVNGARWYRIEGAQYRQILEFKSFFVTSSARDAGSFWCSDERINQIYKLILKAAESNLNHSHTDCPTVEKLGWLEPNHLMAKAVMYNKEVDTLWEKIAADMRDAQYAADESDLDTGAFPHEYKSGLIPSIAPRYARFLIDWNVGSFWDIIPWGSSIILAPYEQYLFYGNQRVLEDNYESAKKYLAYLTQQYHDYNRLYGKSGEERFICAGLGDWGVEQGKGESKENIETAFYYHDLVTMAEISSLLGKGDEAGFRETAKAVKQSYNKSLLVHEGGNAWYRTYDTDRKTQANQAVPLCFGLVPEEHRAGVERTLIDLCENKHLKCGEIGLVYILRALSAAGRNDIIYDMILKDTHPSYLRFVTMGETTLPEFWRDDARSRNHDMMGHIMEWFFTDIAGIRSNDGFQTVSILPRCTDFIDRFDCSYHGIRGEIHVQYADGKLNVTLPCNMKAIE